MQRNTVDRILWILTTHGGLMTKIELAWRLNMELGELDLVIKDLEHIGRIKLAEIEGLLGVGLRMD